MVMGLFDGKVAIVTGAGRGIGRAEALLLAAEGAKVVVNDLGGAATGEGADKSPAEQVVDEIAAAGGAAAANFDDVASWDGADRLVQQAVDTFGGLDVLVNNAGILRDRMSFSMSEDEWDLVVNVHMKGHFCTTHFAGVHWRQLAKDTGDPVDGVIVNTASESGLYGNAGQVNYAAAKAGIAAMTIVVARELERYGVRVNAIAPVARTRLTEAVAGDYMTPKEGDFDRFAPENVAAVACWLASPLTRRDLGPGGEGARWRGAAPRRVAPAHRGHIGQAVDHRRCRRGSRAAVRQVRRAHPRLLLPEPRGLRSCVWRGTSATKRSATSCGRSSTTTARPRSAGVGTSSAVRTQIPAWAREWQATLFDHGWMIPSYPPELGGRDATAVQTLLFLEEMASRGLPRSLHFGGYAIVGPSLLEFGNDDQRALAPAAIRGDTIWCVGMSEPNAGSDLAALSTRAVARW